MFIQSHIQVNEYDKLNHSSILYSFPLSLTLISTAPVCLDQILFGSLTHGWTNLKREQINVQDINVLR